MQLRLPKSVISEPRHFYLHTSAGDERCPDLVVYSLPKYGSGRRSMLKDVAVDVSVTYPLSQSALKAGSSITAMTAGRLDYCLLVPLPLPRVVKHSQSTQILDESWLNRRISVL